MLLLRIVLSQGVQCLQGLQYYSYVRHSWPRTAGHALDEFSRRFYRNQGRVPQQWKNDKHPCAVKKSRQVGFRKPDIQSEHTRVGTKFEGRTIQSGISRVGAGAKAAAGTVEPYCWLEGTPGRATLQRLLCMLGTTPPWAFALEVR